MTHSHRSTYALLALILALAAGLRFFRIDAQSLWNDEGNSARLAERSPALIIDGAAGDIHPPLYYLALSAWRSAFGPGEAALRGLSAVMGVIVVAFVFLLGRRLFDVRVGLLGAFVAAINPFAVYYSQEARMYMMLAAIGLVATYLLVCLLDFWSLRPRIHVMHRRYYVLYVAAMAAGLYTHYAFPFVFASHFAIVLGWAVCRPARARTYIGTWLVLAGAAWLPFLPWLPIALRQIAGWPAQAAAMSAGEALLQTFRYQLLGRTITPQESAAALVVAAFFLILSAWTPDTFDEPEPDWDTAAPRPMRFGTIALYLLVPLALIFAFGLFRDAYLKFLLVASPAFCLLLARGMDNAWHIARGALRMPPELSGRRGGAAGWMATTAALIFVVMGSTAVSLHDLYFDPAYARDDYRAIARWIASHQRADDAVLLHAANQWEVFTYYYSDGPQVIPVAAQRPLDRVATEQALHDAAAAHRRLFVLFWGESEPDPERVVQSWLDTHTYKAGERWFGQVRLATYAVPERAADAPETPVGAQVGDHIRLDGYTLLTPEARPGDIVQLALFWTSDGQVGRRYKVFIHILGSDGRIVAQTDREPGGDRVPTTIWQPDQPVVDHYGVSLPPDLEPGVYSLRVGMYEYEGEGARLPIHGGTVSGDGALDLLPITVTR